MDEIEVKRTYYSSGQIESERSYLTGTPHGWHREWHENGVLASEVYFKKGVPDGIGKQWDKNGNLIVSYEIENGTGVQKSWSEEQGIGCEISLVKGTFTGRHRTYCRDGTIVGDAYWVKNRQVSKKRYLDECKKDVTLPRYDKGVIMAEKEPIPSKEPRTTPPDTSSDKFCENIISSGKAVEAREWLKGRKCYLGEGMDEQETSKFLESFYKSGAVNVWIFEITEDEPGVEYSGRIIIELPSDTQKRRKLIRLSNRVTAGNGFEEEVDYGQKYVFLMLD